ncbi:MAG: serine--tRNA ligase [Limnochordia bacterium]|nr:serine--tRNA ligase [Bacillota bacterium]HOB09762.1 serine--tRNA ligase [Limnochordia bacterium]NLH32162.1 serine--tRNA ligase [Bacillota bacterium]HPT93887.1 serine--tRNA ligase [Limnochordia bacterium]HPZ31712.1 serine--tRNA ligase [Limnochordia bacterium]
MLDLRLIRQDPEAIREMLRKRGEDAPLDELLELDNQRRKLIGEVEQLKAKRNAVSDQIAAMKRNKLDASALIEEMKVVSDTIKDYDEQLRVIDEQLLDRQLRIPNIPHESVHVGASADDNKEIRRWGQPSQFNFEPKPHWDLGVNLDIIDFDRAAKVTGARFYFLKGMGAKLERALINFMLDVHTSEHGYLEVFPPFIVNKSSATGTGQLPKFGEDMFKLENLDYYLIPTAEVPVTNLYRDEILDGDKLPLYHAAYSACFRSEAGAYGRDTRGVIRVHQFNKVELVKFVKPETSYDELEKLVNDAEDILRKLGLPYRVTQMCTADLGFTAAKKLDLEVWMPSYGQYVEISSCSNFEAFQARRANIRFRREPGAKPEYVHTLNGSGVAIGRCLAAVLENYQQADGTVAIPEVLRPYMQGLDKIG